MPLPMMRTTQPDGLNCLPDEVLRNILQLLSLESLLVCERVCRRWKTLVSDCALWASHRVVHSENPRQNLNNLALISSHGECICVLQLMYVEDYMTLKRILERCFNVTSLKLVRCKLNKDFKTDLEKCIRLKKLDIQTCDLADESSDFAIDFSKFVNLCYISLSNFGLNSSNCDQLLQCRNLSHIYVENIKHLNLECMIKVITSRQSILEALHIDGGDAVDDSCLLLLSRCPHLQDLAIGHARRLTDEGLLALANLRRLDRLKVCNNSKFTETCLLTIFKSGSLGSLQSLDLSGVEAVSSNVVDAIAECCTKVRCLTLYRCPKLVGCEKYLDVRLRNLTVALY